MPIRFTRPPFNSYDERTNSVEHVSHYIHMMSLHTHNDALMCKVFPSSLGPTTLRWFNGLWKGSIRSFVELIQEFGAWFVTCSWVPQPVNALLSIKIGVSETIRSYASRYWELYDEIGGGNEKIAVSAFKMGLHENSKLRASLTKRPPEDIRQLMRHIEEYKRLEDDWLQSKGKAKLINRSWSDVFPLRPQRDLRVQELEMQMREVNMAFREPVHKIVDQIKNEPFFRWPNKIGGTPLGEIKTCIVFTTGIKDIQSSNAKCRKTIWSS